jgi:hypothetical protein
MTTPHAQTDPIAAFWRDWVQQSQSQWQSQMNAAQHAAGAAQRAAAESQAAQQGAAPWMLTPEALKKMQGAFLDAMARHADEYMRTPQFLDAMKRSLDQALQFRQQVDGMLRQQAAQAFSAATGGANAELLEAIRSGEKRTVQRLDELADRVARLEGARPARAPKARPARKKSARKPRAK